MPQFTKKAISEAFFRIAATRPPEKITVKDIVEECGVTRNTFYYYFRDVYDVIEDAFLTIAAGIEHVSPQERMENAFWGLSEFLSENRAAMKNICDSVGGDVFASYLSRAVGQQIQSAIRREAGERKLQDGDVQLITVMVREAFFGLLLSWLHGEEQTDLLQLLKRAWQLSTGGVALFLENATRNRDGK